MKNRKKHIFLWLFAVFVIMLPQAAFAIAFPVNTLPYITFGAGAFDFDGSDLSFSTSTPPKVESGGYMDGGLFTSAGTYSSGPPIPPNLISPITDPIYDASISITSPLTYNYTNSDGTYNYHYFTGGSLKISEGITTYLTADFTETVFQQQIGSGVVYLNTWEDMVNIRNISLNTSASRFISEFETASLTGHGLNRPLGSEIFGSFRMDFTVTSGNADFSSGVPSSGSGVSGFVRSAVPEPSSLILMASGLAGLWGLARKRD